MTKYSLKRKRTFILWKHLESREKKSQRRTRIKTDNIDCINVSFYNPSWMQNYVSSWDENVSNFKMFQISNAVCKFRCSVLPNYPRVPYHKKFWTREIRILLRALNTFGRPCLIRTKFRDLKIFSFFRSKIHYIDII